MKFHPHYLFHFREAVPMAFSEFYNGDCSIV
ncbi:uncharacterized protein METZ01_LOCUS326630 [marine metagenome]|uniref:Uncharacterized protein n=1 Tax=marine metagenome TaxID=408172 RepID=A0A382PKJ0_9ZZZZ